MPSPVPTPVDAPEPAVHPLISLRGWELGQPFHEPLSPHDEAALAAANRNAARLFVAAGTWDARTYERLLCQPCGDSVLLTE